MRVLIVVCVCVYSCVYGPHSSSSVRPRGARVKVGVMLPNEYAASCDREPGCADTLHKKHVAK